MFSVCKSLRLFSISVASPYQWSFQKTYKIQQDYRATWELECFPFWQRKCIYFQIYTVKMSCHLGFYIKWGRKIFKITQIPPELFFGPLTTHTCRCEHRHTSTNVYACVHMYTCSHKRTCMHVYNQTPANTHTHTHTPFYQQVAIMSLEITLNGLILKDKQIPFFSHKGNKI
jgi:hypothetical protein